MVIRKSWQRMKYRIDKDMDCRFDQIFNIDELQELQDAFATAMGVSAIITDPYGNHLTKPSNYCSLCTDVIGKTALGAALCAKSHGVPECGNAKGPSFKYCLSAGMMDGGASIYIGDVHIANWLIGQVLDDKDSDERLLAFGRSIGADDDAFRAALATVPRMSREKYESICKALFLCAKQISTLAVQNVIQEKIIIEEKKREEAIAFLSVHDPLTGLYNRRYFEDAMKALNKTYTPPLTIVMGDANGLKMVNDVFGHDEGDKLLLKISNIFTATFRSSDIIARVGGDEFAVIMPETSRQEAEDLIRQIKHTCENQKEGPIFPSIALGIFTAERKNQNLEKIMKSAEDQMYSNKLLESKSIRSSIISSLRKTLEERTHETEAHCQRLKFYMIELAKAMGLGENQLSEYELLAILHDIGKVAIPDSILTKPCKLSSDEWRIMRSHCEIGYRIASSTPELITIAEPVLYHHERWDGKGYPTGLSNEAIPLSSRILAVVDAFDALTHNRPYHKAVSPEFALEEIQKCAGTHFDPIIVGLFTRILKEELETVSCTS